MLRLADGGLAWDRVVEIARHNRMVPPLFWQLRRIAELTVPAEAMSELAKGFFAASLRNLMVTREATRILDLLREQDIAAVPLRGPMLVEPLYDNNPALRHFQDLDVLVRRDDVLRAKKALAGIGYETKDPMTAAEEAAYLESDCEFHLWGRNGQLELELHWDLLPKGASLGVTAELVWENTTPAMLGPTQTLTVTPELLFLLLCVHGGGKHSWAQLRRVGDAAQALANFPGLDWDWVWREATRARRVQDVLVGCWLASNLLGAPVPPTLAARIRANRQTAALGALAWGRMFRDGFGLPGYAEWQGYLGNNAAGASRPGLFGYARAVITPEWDDARTLPLPSWLSPVRYASRPIRLARRHGKGILKRLF